MRPEPWSSSAVVCTSARRRNRGAGTVAQEPGTRPSAQQRQHGEQLQGLLLRNHGLVEHRGDRVRPGMRQVHQHHRQPPQPRAEEQRGDQAPRRARFAGEAIQASGRRPGPGQRQERQAHKHAQAEQRLQIQPELEQECGWRTGAGRGRARQRAGLRGAYSPMMQASLSL